MLDEGFFLIELILNRADQFLQDVLQGDQSDCAAVFIHDEREMEFALEKEAEELFESRGLRNKDDLAGHRRQVTAAFSLGVHVHQVFGVNHAKRLVDVTAFAQRKA